MADARRPRKKAAPRVSGEMRRQAEEGPAGLSAALPASPVPEELTAAVDELRVHQIELETQNEELRRAQLELEEQREKYFELFDMAPVGFLTLSDCGIIGDANLTAAQLLGVERQLLVGQPFSDFILAADQDAYYRHRLLLTQTGAPQSCELRLQRVGAEPFWAHLEWHAQRAAADEPLRYHLTFTDVPERALAEQALRESEARCRDVVELATDGIAILQGGLFIFVNETLARVSGYSVDELQGMPFLAVVREGQHAHVAERLRRRLAGEVLPARFETDNVRKDGTPFIMEVSASVIAHEGAPAALVLMRDITERKQAEEELARTLSLLESTMESTADGILVADGRGAMVRSNAKFREMWGLPEAIVAAKDDDAALSVVLDRLKEPEVFLGTARDLYGAPDEISFDVLGLKDGRVFERYSQPQRIGADVVGRVWSFRDVTERKQAEQEIRQRNQELAHLNEELVDEAVALAEANATITRIAATDDLTSLANRRYFYESLEKAVSLARRHGSPLSLVSFDLDGLKRVNDSSGHEAGDEVLTSFAALLIDLCRAEDLPGRLGGDEFSVLLPGIELSGGGGLAERTREAVRSCAALAERGVTVSGGVVQWSPGELSDDLLRHADEALYAAKRGGGGAVAGNG